MQKCLGISTILCLLLTCTSVFANSYNWRVVRVIDGDTIVVEAPWLLPELGNTISIRTIGIDTPEKEFRAHCPREAALAEQASSLIKSIVKPGDTVAVEIAGRDKYFRILGDIVINGKRVSSILISAGLAVPYTGGTKKSWC